VSSQSSPSALGPACQCLVRTLRSTIGAKTLMALTGLSLVGFVLAHMAGNMAVFAGRDALNGYAEKLQSLGAILWVMRGGLLAIFVLHLMAARRVAHENRAARPVPYAHAARSRATSYAARTMLMSGLIVLAFVLYHLAHFTFAVAHADIVAGPKGAGDVYAMVVNSFHDPIVVLAYVAAQIVLCVHISHGASSAFQTLGLTYAPLEFLKAGLGKALAVLILVGNLAIPLSILFGAIG